LTDVVRCWRCFSNPFRTGEVKTGQRNVHHT
jgi:hypothetical protein